MRYKCTGSFDCSNNKLTSLIGAPEFVRTSLWVESNLITSFEGCPKGIIRRLSIYSNRLKNFKGLPSDFKADLDVANNPLESLEGIPKELDALDIRFIIGEDGKVLEMPMENGKKFNARFTYKDIKKVCKVKGSVQLI